VKNSKNNKGLDVDFIGGQTPLTKEELQKISEYIKTQKQARRRPRATKTLQRKKMLA